MPNNKRNSFSNQKNNVWSTTKWDKRSTKPLTPYYFDDSTRKIYFSYWYMMSVKCPTLEKTSSTWRSDVLYTEYLMLLARVKDQGIFSQCMPHRGDCFGRRSLSSELLLLGALCYLGRGLTFDGLEEYTVEMRVTKSYTYLLIRDQQHYSMRWLRCRWRQKSTRDHSGSIVWGLSLDVATNVFCGDRPIPISSRVIWQGLTFFQPYKTSANYILTKDILHVGMIRLLYTLMILCVMCI